MRRKATLRSWLLLLTVSRVAMGAESVEQCVVAHEAGQREEKAERLLLAKDLYETCGADTCPDLVRSECRKLGTDLQRRIPTVQVRVSGATGEISLEIDDRDWPSVPSTPIPIDPGTRVIRVTTAAGKTLVREIEVEPGTARDVVFEVPDLPSEPDAADSKSVPIAAYVAGGVGVVGFAGFVGFGLAGRSKQDTLDDCKGSCTDHSLYEDMKANYLLADIGLAVGVAASALAVYFVLDAPKQGSSATDGRGRLRSTPQQHWLGARARSGGASLQFGGSF